MEVWDNGSWIVNVSQQWRDPHPFADVYTPGICVLSHHQLVILETVSVIFVNIIYVNTVHGIL